MMRSIRGDLATFLKDGLDVEIVSIRNQRGSGRGASENRRRDVESKVPRANRLRTVETVPPNPEPIAGSDGVSPYGELALSLVGN